MKLFQSRHRAAKGKLARRTFLTALGLGLSAPLAYKMSRFAIAEPGGRPCRLFIMFLPHGAPIEHYDVGPDMDLAMSGVGILSPLEPYRDHVHVLQGVGNHVANNHAAITSVLTGRESDDSIDYLIANELGVLPHALGLHPLWPGASSVGANSKLIKHGGWVSPIDNPADALEDLFPGLPAGGGATSGPSPDVEFRRQALSLTEAEIAAMQGQLGGLTSEQNKLQVHLEAIQSLKGTLEGSGVVSCDGRPSLPNAEAMAGKDALSADFMGQALDGHLEAAAHAFLCGTASVATLQLLHVNTPVRMDFAGGPGIGAAHHDPLSHSSPSDTTGRENFALSQKFFYERLAESFLSVLNQPDPADPEHTVLDNTTILTCSEISDGQNHNSDNSGVWMNGQEVETYLPWTIIGGGAGYFGPGGAVRLAKEDHRNVLATVAAAMGVPLQTVGGFNTTEIAGLKA